MTRSFSVAVLLPLLLPGTLLGQSGSARTEAVRLEERANLLMMGSGAEGRLEAARLYAEAAALWAPDAARLYEWAGAAAAGADAPLVAARHYARALRLRRDEAALDGLLLDRLGASPLDDPDGVGRGPSDFVDDTRNFARTLDLQGVEALAGSLESAGEAQAFLETLYGADRTTEVTIRSSGPRLEVHVLPTSAFIYGGPPEIVRTDTTLVREPVGYVFCYLDPDTGNPMRLRQSCRFGCVTELPSDLALRTTSCDPPPPSGGGA